MTRAAQAYMPRIRVTVVGSDGGRNKAAITDRAGNPLERSYSFTFETVGPTLLPR